jgi:hypothetical protein
MGTPRVWVPAHRIATSSCPREDLSATPKTPPGAFRGLGSSHSISIGDGAVSPPRSGFVLRLCIRKADGAWGKPRSAPALRIQDSADDARRRPRWRPPGGCEQGAQARALAHFRRVSPRSEEACQGRSRASVAIISLGRSLDRLRPRRVEPHDPGRTIQPDAGDARLALPARVHPDRVPPAARGRVAGSPAPGLCPAAGRASAGRR